MKSRTRASIVLIHDNSVLVFKAVDPTSGDEYWFLPGGGIEEGEAPWVTAERETLEETGYKVKAIRKSEIIKQYPFFWDGVHYDSKTFFYRGELTEPWHEPKRVDDADYNKGPNWIPLAMVKELLGYNKEIVDAVIELSEG